MTRNSPNFGIRTRLNPITPSSSTAPKTNTVNIKDPELIQEFDKQRRQQSDFKTIQISIESYKALQKMTTYFNMASCDDIIQIMVKHFRENVYPEYGKYYDVSTE